MTSSVSLRIALVSIMLAVSCGATSAERQWPWLFGPYSNSSAIDYGGRIKAMPTVRWKSSGAGDHARGFGLRQAAGSY